MAKKSTFRPPSAFEAAAATRPAVTLERFDRLCRLVRFLAAGSRTRAQITRHLRLDVRGFYRDLELLRTAGLPVTLSQGRYGLNEPEDSALARLPFPDPRLTLGEALRLARGRTLAHRRLQELIDDALS
jgi:predicted DNA-binding transcriptional regulator YafY